MKIEERLHHHPLGEDEKNIGGGARNELTSDLTAGGPSKESVDTPVKSPVLTPSKERAENFVTHSSLGKNVFSMNEKGVLVVVGPQNSEIMKGHLGCGLPLVPGVIQGSALTSDAYTQGKTVSVEFGGKVLLPGHKVVICDNELHKYLDDPEKKYSDSTKVLRVTLSDDEIALPEHAYSKNINAQFQDDFVSMDKKELDDHLLQEGAFRFMSGVTRQEVVKDGDEFLGHRKIPKDFPWIKEGKVDSAVLVESSAQIGSRFFSSSLNKGEKLRDGDEANPGAKIITLTSSVHKELKAKVHPGDTVYVYGKISQCSNASVKEKRAKLKDLRDLKDKSDTNPVKIRLQEEMAAMNTDSHFVYLMVNQKGEEILKGELAGVAMEVSDLIMLRDRALRDS